MSEINTVLLELSSKIPNLNYIKEVKSGKEATVHLVSNGIYLYALKIYKTNSKYSTRLEYLNLETAGDSRTQRAIKNRTKTGVAKLESIWTNREYSLMKELHEYSTNIPKVFASTSSAILMEYFGDELSPAPKLSDVSLNLKDAQFCFKEVVENIELFIDFGFVHGDLSEYNILWWENQAYIIDFPQTLDIKTNKNTYQRFQGDLANIEKYFLNYLEEDFLKRKMNELRNQFHEKRIYG